MSAAQRASKTGNAEQANEWAVPVNEYTNKQADEQMAYNLTRQSDMIDQFLTQSERKGLRAQWPVFLGCFHTI